MSKLIDTATNVFKTIVRVVLYLRLSDEDRDKLTKEELSESIKNQEMMLRDYAEQQGWEIVGVYNDEDYSGSDRERPNFNIMIGECEKGNVDVVLVKTQARFARDVKLVEIGTLLIKLYIRRNTVMYQQGIREQPDLLVLKE